MLHTESHRAAPAAGGIPHSDPPTRIVVRFCERLRHLPLGVWAEASERLAELEGATSAARRRLRATVDRVPGAVARVSPRVHELVSVAEGFMAPSTTARMKKSAMTAALALLARPHLSEEDFRGLYQPFAKAIPLAELERDVSLYVEPAPPETPMA